MRREVLDNKNGGQFADSPPFFESLSLSFLDPPRFPRHSSLLVERHSAVFTISGSPPRTPRLYPHVSTSPIPDREPMINDFAAGSLFRYGRLFGYSFFLTLLALNLSPLWVRVLGGYHTWRPPSRSPSSFINPPSPWVVVAPLPF